MALKIQISYWYFYFGNLPNQLQQQRANIYGGHSLCISTFFPFSYLAFVSACAPFIHQNYYLKTTANVNSKTLRPQAMAEPHLDYKVKIKTILSKIKYQIIF